MKKLYFEYPSLHTEINLSSSDNIHLSEITTVSPYLAMRYSEKYQKGYTEKNVDLPLTFNKIFELFLRSNLS